MATTTTKRTRFSRRLPDHVTDELVAALMKKRTYEFNALFETVYENLKLRNAVSGGEEMLRLRAYEKLQNLVSRGMVEKVAKTYRGLEKIKDAIAHYGLTAADLGLASVARKHAKAAAASGGKPVSKRRKKGGPKPSARAVKFKDDRGNTWGGMGKRPVWFKAALAAGKTPEDLLAKG